MTAVHSFLHCSLYTTGMSHHKIKIRYESPIICSPSDSFGIRMRCNTYRRDEYENLVGKTEEFAGPRRR